MHTVTCTVYVFVYMYAQRDKTHQVAKLVRRSSSKKKSGDPYTSAVAMARKLYMLDGYTKSEVAPKL